MLVIPKTKHIASKMFDLPDPLRPVIALNDASQPVIVVRTGYDLKPRKNRDMAHAYANQVWAQSK